MAKQLKLIIIFIFALLITSCSKQSIMLMPEDADLSDAPNVILEPDKEPYNLGGFKYDDAVYWETEIKEEGMYSVELEYSRPGKYPDTWGVVEILTDEEVISLRFTAKPTGSDKEQDVDEDWSKYQKIDGLAARLSPGVVGVRLYEIEKPYSESPISRKDMPIHFMNLRSISLTKE